MENESAFNLIHSIFKLNKVQVLFANYALKKLNEDYNHFHYIESHEIKKAVFDYCQEELSKDDITYTMDILEYDFYFVDRHHSVDKFKITHNGKEILQKHSDFVAYLAEEIKDRFEEVKQNQEENEIKTQIQDLTIKQLKGSIFQVNKWWVILIINAFVTVIVSVIVALIIFKLGIN